VRHCVLKKDAQCHFMAKQSTHRGCHNLTKDCKPDCLC